MDTPQQLKQVRERLDNGENVVFATPRELVGWFGQYRRTWRQVKTIRAVLKTLELQTSPDFEGSGFDEPIVLQKEQAPLPIESSSSMTGGISTSDVTEMQPEAEVAKTEVVDPVHRVSRFLPSTTLVSVSRDEKTEVAITKMMLNDFSQLPVMQGDMKVSGMISWRSIGRRHALRCDSTYVRDCLEPHYEIKAEYSIFDAIPVIQSHDCVLVRSKENRITGILTATDISGSFEQLSRPFLLLSYVENHLRALIQPKFSTQDLQSAKDPSDEGREITDVSDMTFGEYVRLLENNDNWSKLEISIERKLFTEQLNDVRNIRNDVMHFNPEGIEDKDMDKLRRFSLFLESIVSQISKN